MDCPHTTLETTDAFFKRFVRTAREQRIPLSGGMSLTNRCNLRCVHCYIRPANGDAAPVQELATERWLSILDEVAEAGCLFFLITGGEPLLAPGFPAVYRRARQNGLLVTVFTNGTLVDDAVLELFDAYPPSQVEISLYGATEATYERVTGVPGSYRKCLRGMERLREHGIQLQLKSVLMTPTDAEFEAIRRMAADFGCKFRMDAYLVPHVSGDKRPMDYRVKVERAVEVEFQNPAVVAAWKRLHDMQATYQRPETLYACNAGRTGFHIDAAGRLQICMMENRWGYDLRDGSFKEGWLKVLPGVLEHRAPGNSPCQSCPDWLFCQCCSPQKVMETGGEELPPRFLCEMGAERRRRIERELSGELPHGQGNQAGQEALREADSARH